MKTNLLMTAMAVLLLSACGNTAEKTKADTSVTAEVSEKSQEIMEKADAMKKSESALSLADILAAQDDAAKARYGDRNPGATLEYFGIKPGMTVAEVLPGGGWYSKILIPYLGDDGHLVGIDYEIDMWAKFGGFATEEFLEGKKSWAEEWVADATEWRGDSQTDLSAFAFGSAPDAMKGTVDVVFMPRAIHHLHRFEKAHLAGALSDMKMILKPDGIVAIVAHRAAEDQPDDWANGNNGYMKQSTVIQIMDDAGFELAAAPSEINANPKDLAKAANKDMVWRLPPTLGTSREDPELRAKLEAIGETDRMTLKFRAKQ